MKSQKHSLILFLFFSLSYLSAQSEKGIWLTDVASEALDSRQGIHEVVQTCKTYGIGQIYVVVWNRGHTLYPSLVME